MLGTLWVAGLPGTRRCCRGAWCTPKKPKNKKTTLTTVLCPTTVRFLLFFFFFFFFFRLLLLPAEVVSVGPAPWLPPLLQARPIS